MGPTASSKRASTSSVARGGRKRTRGRKSTEPQLNPQAQCDADALTEEVEPATPAMDNVENEEQLNEEENRMQIVPYVLRPEVVQEVANRDESSIEMLQGEDILNRVRIVSCFECPPIPLCRIVSCFECPPIPLCRMIPYAKVRGLRDDLSGLKIAFGREGYVPEKGVFIVSVCTCDKEETLVTEGIEAGWDPLWKSINREFEEEIQAMPNLKILAGRMFYVWEGNHKTVAWTEAIKEKFATSRGKHVRVLSTIIDPSRVSEISLLSCLQRMNFLNTHALVVTSLRDELVNTANICSANPEAYLKELPEEDVKLIAKIRKKYTKGTDPWFPLTRRYLGRLVYNVQFYKDLHKRLDPVRSSMSKEEFRKYESKEMDELTRKYSDRIGKILNIVDPSLGDEEWWKRVLSLKWHGESFATLEKLNLLALSDVSNDTKLFWVTLFESNKVTKAMFALPRGDHDYRM